MQARPEQTLIAYIERELSTIPGMTVFHSYGNFILLDAKGTGKTGDDIVAYAQEKGIILRPQSKMYGSEGFFRITVGTKEENKIMVKAVKEFCAK